MREKENYFLSKMHLKDLLGVHKMYDSLTSESKDLIPSRILGLTTKKSWYWILGQVALIISCFPRLRECFRRVFPKASFLWLLAKNQQDEIIGFAYLRGITRNLKDGDLYLGICVLDNYQGRGIGYKLMEGLINWARGRNADLTLAREILG
ncbi:GNAT family N-acetyltransferase [Dehalococcoidales bacterium]|nr:GNAT family N-acetyltransferase [Dehalococcoidales bacterium]